MSDSIKKNRTDEWIPGIKSLFLGFLNDLQTRPGGQYLRFNDGLGTIEKPGVIVKEYHDTVSLIKENIFGENDNDELIDYHKIAALYIRSFLIHKPFYLDVPEEERKTIDTCLYTEFPNEYFVIVFLETMFKAWKNDFDGVLEMDPNYQDDFIKLLYHYKEYIKRLDPLSFSNIIFLIEQKYFLNSWSRVQFESDVWIPDIKYLCINFLNVLHHRPGGRYLKFKDYLLGTTERPGRIVIDYHYNVNLYKNEIFNKDTGKVDYHKIVALYIRSFLKYKPFFFDEPKETKNVETCLYTEFSNEYFVIVLLEVMLKTWNEDFDSILKMDQNYQDEFIKLLFYYKEDINRFDMVSFSNTIFFIEQQHFHCNQENKCV